jgi:UDP-glucose 4-epimerase
MKVLVIGGSGFLGSRVSDFLSKNGYKVTILDKKKSIWINKNQSFIKGDISNVNSLKKAIKGKRYVYNFAAISDIEESNSKLLKTAHINIICNLKILQICKNFNVKRFIFASTVYTHSKQGGYYRVSKQSAELFIEEFCKRNNLNYTILRYGSIYGPRANKNNGINKIVSKAINKKKLEYGGSSQAKRRFIHIDDASILSVDILKNKYSNSNVLVTGNKNYNLKKVLYLIKKKTGIKSKILFKNYKNQDHYNISPYSYIPQKDKLLKKNKFISLEKYFDDILKK